MQSNNIFDMGIERIQTLKRHKLPLHHVRVYFRDGTSHRFCTDSNGEYHAMHRLPESWGIAQRCLDCNWSTH